MFTERNRLQRKKLQKNQRGAQRVDVDTKYETDRGRLFTERDRQREIDYRERSCKRTKGGHNG